MQPLFFIRERSEARRELLDMRKKRGLQIAGPFCLTFMLWCEDYLSCRPMKMMRFSEVTVMVLPAGISTSYLSESVRVMV